MNPGIAFFFFWITLQFLLPLRRFLRAWQSNAPSLQDYDYDHFCWNMKSHSSASQCFFILFNRETGEELQVLKYEDFLLPRQARWAKGHPHGTIQFAHFLLELYKKETQLPLEHIGIKAFFLLSVNERPETFSIDEAVDLTQQTIQPFGTYSWMYPSRSP